MPELAELRFTSDYINKVSKDKIFDTLLINSSHKWKKEWNISKKPFKIKSKSRGKELILYMNSFPIRMTMGMSGYFRMTESNKEWKHSHLIFKSTCGHSLSFVDVRRFGKWWPGEEWSDNRGPDPTLDFDNFCRNIKESINKRVFNKPICEMLLNQKYFNGIGNYLRAEIIYRIPELSPFMCAREAIEKYPEILELCKHIPELAYIKGGGKIKDWNNPLGKESEKFMKCYGNPNMINEKDKTGRTIWYRPEHQWQRIEDDKWDHYSGLPNPLFYDKL